MIKIKDPNNVSNIKEINGEEIRYKAKVSNVLLYIPSSFMIISIFLLFKIYLPFSLCILLFNLLCIFIVYLYIKNSFIYITDTKIHYYFGVFDNNYDALLFNKINKIEVRQSIFEMIINVGNINLIGNSGEREVFTFIEKPKELKNIIITMLKG